MEIISIDQSRLGLLVMLILVAESGSSGSTVNVETASRATG